MSLIVAGPHIQAGGPTIRGTRIPTRCIWVFWCAGYPIGAIKREYPSLCAERIWDAIFFERRRRQRTRLRLRPRGRVTAQQEGLMGKTKRSVPVRDEVRRNANQSLDEVVVSRPDFFHLEQMSERTWWIGITKKGKELHVWIQCDAKGTLSVEVTENEIGAAEVITDQLRV